MRQLLQNRGFRNLWLAQVTLALGDAVMQMGLVELFHSRGYSVRNETAKLLFAVALPAVVLGPAAVAWLDRWQRRNVLMIGDAGRALLIAAIAVWAVPTFTSTRGPGALWMVYALVFLIGSITAFYYPARYALIPNLVEAKDLVQANTLFTTSLAVANIGGRALGGFVAERLGVTWALLANVLAYLASIALVWQITMVPHSTTRQAPLDSTGQDGAPIAGKPGRHLLGGGAQELRQGLVYLWHHPSAMPLVLLSGVFAFVLGVLAVSIVGYAMDTMGLRTGDLGYLVAAAGAGAAIGIVAMGRARPWTKSAWLPLVQLTLVGVLLVLLGLTRNVWVAAPLLVGLGAVGATVLIPIDAKLQEEVDDKRRGAVFAARGILTSATMVVAFWLQFGTEFFRRTPAPQVLIFLGFGSILSAFIAFFLLRSRRSHPPTV
ncbi:MFS transporter [bacterium]|nr:MFS transporter [bacterium]